MSEQRHKERLDHYIKRLARLPDPKFWQVLDDDASVFWELASRETLVQLYWERVEAGLWRKPDKKKSRGRFVMVAISMIDEVGPYSPAERNQNER